MQQTPVLRLCISCRKTYDRKDLIKITKDHDHDSFLIFRLILNFWLTETVKSKAVLGSRFELDITKWIDIREEVNNLFNKAESVNLDPKQVVLNVFFAIAAVEQDGFRGVQ